MTLAEISDKLFYISLIVIMVGVIASGVGSQGFFPRKSDKVPGEYEKANKSEMVERQDAALARLARSKLFWGGVAGVIVSIVLTSI